VLKSISKPEDWQELLPENDLFKLVYGVLICESLTIDPEYAEAESQLEKRAAWRTNFLEKKGFEHLIKVLHSFQYTQSMSTMPSMREQKSEADDFYSDQAMDVMKNTQQLALTSVLKMVCRWSFGFSYDVLWCCGEV